MRRVASILILTLLITSLFVFSFSTQGVEAIKSRTITKLFIDPDFVSEPVGSNFTIAVKISNITNLFGLEIMLNWNPAVIEYINHTNKIPVETYPDGVLHEPVLWLPVGFNTTAGDYQIAVASFGDPPPPSFNGSGTVFEMTFDVVNIGFSPIDIILSNLATKPNATHPWGLPIPHEVINGTFNNGPAQYQLIIDTVGSGTTNPTPGSYMYDQGTVVSVDAIPSQGWILDHWLLDGSDVGSVDPYSVTMNSDHNLTAVFIEVYYQLVISTIGSGTTDPAPESYLYLMDTVVLVDAIPDPGWMLDYWLLDGSDMGSTDPYSVTMDGNHTLIAVFVHHYQLIIDTVGSGTTDPTPGSYLYKGGTEVSVDSIPDLGWALDYWLFDGDDVGSTDPYIVTMNANHTLTAVFNEVYYQLTIDVIGSGTTDPAPENYLFTEGTNVPVEAIPDAGSVLDYWLLDGDNVGWISPYTITMDANHTLTAVFVEVTHDVAIINATTSKTGCLPVETVGQGYNVTVYVTVENQGNIVETFNVTIYVNISAIRESEVTLNRGETKTLMFVWNTSGFEKGNYTISATADIVLGETDTADNTIVDGTVLVTLAGDVDGDRDVDIYDIVMMAGIYGTTEEDPQYDPNCDIDGDGDIDIYDIVAAANNYGESW